MARRHAGVWKTPSSKGKSRRGKGRGSYSKKNKARNAERYIRYNEFGLGHK